MSKKEEVKEVVEDKPQEQADLLSLIEKLVPPDNIVILDIFGNEYKKPSVLSARKQIKVVREFEKVIAHISESEFTAQNSSQVIDFLIRASTDETVLDHLASCFLLAFEDVVEKSIEYANKKKIEVDSDSPVIDLFSLEDIVGSIVPLFIRLAKKLVGAIAHLNKI